MKKTDLIKMLGEYRGLTRMIKRVSIIYHDDIDDDEWSDRIECLEKKTTKLIKRENDKAIQKEENVVDFLERFRSGIRETR